MSEDPKGWVKPDYNMTIRLACMGIHHEIKFMISFNIKLIMSNYMHL